MILDGASQQHSKLMKMMKYWQLFGTVERVTVRMVVEELVQDKVYIKF
jgi:hypothetical protein